MSSDPLASLWDGSALRVEGGPLWAPLAPRRGLVARVDEALNYTGPIVYGVAAWAAACRLTFLMRWLKAGDSEYAEADLIA